MPRNLGPLSARLAGKAFTQQKKGQVPAQSLLRFVETRCVMTTKAVTARIVTVVATMFAMNRLRRVNRVKWIVSRQLFPALSAAGTGFAMQPVGKLVRPVQGIVRTSVASCAISRQAVPGVPSKHSVDGAKQVNRAWLGRTRVPWMIAPQATGIFFPNTVAHWRISPRRLPLSQPVLVC